MTEQAKSRVGIVAVDPLRALGLQSILHDALGFDVVELELDRAAAEPDLAALLLDGGDDAEDLLDTIAVLRRQRADIKVVVLCRISSPEFIQAIIGAGARGCLSDTASEKELRMAMDVVLDGSVWAPRKVLAKLIDAAGVAVPDQTPSPQRLLDQVTPREREVLDLLMEGRSNREIAESLRIDEVTVKAHLGRMLRKAGVSNRVELTLRALEEQGGILLSKKRSPVGPAGT